VRVAGRNVARLLLGDHRVQTPACSFLMRLLHVPPCQLHVRPESGTATRLGLFVARPRENQGCVESQKRETIEGILSVTAKLCGRCMSGLHRQQ
jgi:hypothetical protein